jgi:two-component system response regulator PilR (NtrC family)
MKSMLVLVATCRGRIIQFPLRAAQSELTVGSLPQNDIYLPYTGVSRRHFGISQTPGGWMVRDLDSTNGIHVNRKKVQQALLQPGDLLQAGGVEVRIRQLDDAMFVGIADSSSGQKLPGNPASVTTDVFSALSPAFSSFPRLKFPEGMIPGKSPRMNEVYEKLNLLVDSDVNVLLIGETGSGKEMIAKMLHLSGSRAQHPFIAVNCAAMPADLVEAELFGIGEKVATDVNQRKGKILLADKGILFLDELSAFPMPQQAKILRAIEEKVVYPVGENRPVPVDFRLICATNMQPADLIRAGMLREDLYHRIGTVELTVPPLRERKEDIELLCVALLRIISFREKKYIAGITRKLLSILSHYQYPGNVRELSNILSSMIALANSGEILDVHLAPGRLLEGATSPMSADEIQIDAAQNPINLREAVDDYTRKLVMQSLHAQDWNLTKTAKSLQMTTFGLRKMMIRLGIPSKKIR